MDSNNILHFFLHLDEYLKNIIQMFGPFTYLILFLIIFVETGLVIVPFLPGDSLLFIAGTLAGGGYLQIIVVYIVLLLAATIGDTVNYWIGYKLGEKLFLNKNSKLFRREYLEKTQAFYEKYGGKTIILARFLPILRTFAPFVAGVGKMHYKTFLTFNLVGGFLWVTLLTFLGYFFGGLPLIKNNFEFAIIGIVLISIIPMMYELIKYKKKTGSNTKLAYKDLKNTFKKEHLND